MKTITITTARGSALDMSIEHTVIENAYEDLFPLPSTTVDEVHVTTSHKGRTFTATFFPGSAVTLLPQHLFSDPDNLFQFAAEMDRLGASRVLCMTAEDQDHETFFALSAAEADRLDAAVASAFAG